MDPGETLLKTFQNLRVWQRDERRARHKPLLLLYALARIQAGASRLLRFVDLEDTLRQALDYVASERKRQQPEYPFWWLQSDGIWEVVADREMRPRRKDRKDPPIRELRDANARGGFMPEFYEWLASRPENVLVSAKIILDTYFAESLHGDICAIVGLTLDLISTPEARKRAANFRALVLTAYEYRCAVCGFNAQLDGRVIGLEAAHLKPHGRGGSSTLDNGLALCPLHHKCLDLGLIGFEGRRIIVSSRVTGGDEVGRTLLTYHGRELLGPQTGQPALAEENIKWHTDVIFKSDARKHQ